MKIIKAKDYDQMSRKAANIISAQVIMKPDCVLGLATGSSPIGTYRQLIDWYNKGDVDFSECYSVNLDEYVGLDITSDQSYVYFMRHNFFDAINIREDHTFIPNGKNTDVAAECERYDNQIALWAALICSFSDSAVMDILVSMNRIRCLQKAHIA